MSRVRRDQVGFRLRFPRVSGDEPLMNGVTQRFAPFSPRERG